MFGLLSIISNENLNAFVQNAKGIFAGFKPSDAIDIVILALLFFFAFRFFKSRKAGTLLVGILIFALLYGIAAHFDLHGVEYILSGVSKIGVLCVVIILQPEIREILETIGNGSLKGIRSFADQTHKKQAQYKAIDNICKSVHVMAAEKTGALIVISRTTQLDDILHSGTVINADVSDSLIRNLFFNRAPLHDGAIVIEEGKISAAACILPLPRRTQVASELGTRHRAAVGLSEISDAIIVVVSEETGAISVAVESELMRGLSPENLRKFLVEALIREKRTGENRDKKNEK
jgi:diadenylate cyclase